MLRFYPKKKTFTKGVEIETRTAFPPEDISSPWYEGSCVF